MIVKQMPGGVIWSRNSTQSSAGGPDLPVMGTQSWGEAMQGMEREKGSQGGVEGGLSTSVSRGEGSVEGRRGTSAVEEGTDGALVAGGQRAGAKGASASDAGSEGRLFYNPYVEKLTGSLGAQSGVGTVESVFHSLLKHGQKEVRNYSRLSHGCLLHSSSRLWTPRVAFSCEFCLLVVCCPVHCLSLAMLFQALDVQNGYLI